MDKNTANLRKLIVENPDMPLIVFVGEEAWSGNYGWEEGTITSIGIKELILVDDAWLNEDEYRDKLFDDLAYMDMPFEDYCEMIDKRVQNSKLKEYIVVYID